MRVKILMEPVPKGRPRHAKNGRIYTPQKTKRAELIISNHVKMRMLETGTKKITGAVDLGILFTMGIPRSWSQKKRDEYTDKPCEKSTDLDNLIKLCADGMNHSGIWDDDAQVCRLNAEMIWGIEPSVIIMVIPWED